MPDGFILSVPMVMPDSGNPRFYAEAVTLQIANAGHEIVDLLVARYGTAS